MTVSEWADRNIVLPLNTPKPGPIRIDFTPALREPIDSIGNPAVERVSMMAAAQSGKTTVMLCGFGFIVDHDPGEMLLVMPSADLARELLDERILPVIRSSRRLSSYLTGRRGQRTLSRIKFDRMVFHVTGSNSPAALSSRPVRYLWIDETDKLPPWIGREADPVSLAEVRTQNFADRKIVTTSSPTTRDGLIWREFEAGDRRRYWVPCPACGTFQILDWSRIVWKKDVPADQLEEPGNAWFQCQRCEHRVFEGQKLELLRAGLWVPEEGEIRDGRVVAPPTRHRSYHLSVLCSPFVSFGRVVQQWLAAQHDAAKLQHFTNSWMGWIWESLAERLEDQAVDAARRPYSLHQVPAGCLWLTAGVDVQKDHFYFVVRAWAPGMTSWLVDAARVETWQALAGSLFGRPFPVAGGGELRVRMAFIDIGGHRRDEVVAFCRRWVQAIRPCRGVGEWQYGRRNVPLWASTIDRSPRGSVIQGGLQLWNIEVGGFKDQIARRMRIPETEIGGWQVPRELPHDYARQVVSEQRVRQRDRRTGGFREVWQKKPGVNANHYLDCEVYAMAAAEMIGVSRVRNAGESDEPPPTAPPARPPADPDWPAPPRGAGGRGSNWSGAKRKGWLR